MIAKIFGKNNALLYPYIQLIVKENIQKRYFFMNQDEWQRILFNSKSFGNKICWTELLNRVHYASIVNLIRTQKWIDSSINSYENSNLLAFCSSIRGLIEFGSDANFTFGAIPFHLAEEFGDIKSIFDGEREEIIVNQALEDALLHFSFAGKHQQKGERTKVYNAKQIRQYIDYSDKNGKLYKFYQYLSGFTHPSTESIISYLEFEPHPQGEYLSFAMKDQNIINQIIIDNHKILDNVLCLAIYPSLFNLKMLTQFDIDDYKCNSILGLYYEQFDIWNEIKSKINYEVKTVSKKQSKNIARIVLNLNQIPFISYLTQ